MKDSFDSSKDIENSVYSLARKLSLVFILIAIIAFGILLLPILVDDYDFSKLGSLGDTTGGFLNPIIAIAAALLTFLAFYVQYRANKQIEKQFEIQQINESQNFEYSRIKERIHLILNEIDDFEVAFHKGQLISKLDEISSSTGKKYNFSGVQGLNLFLIELFRNKEINLKNKTLDLRDAYHSVAMNIENIIVLFYNSHKTLKSSSLNEEYKSDLEELMIYLYQSKLSYIVERYKDNTTKDYKLNKFLVELSEAYNKTDNK